MSDSQNVQNAGCVDVFTRNALEETSSQVIIQSNFGRKAESGSGILRKE